MDHNWLTELQERGSLWLRKLLSLLVTPGQEIALWDGGAITIGNRRNPEEGSEHWLHTLYPGLDLDVLENLQMDFGMRYSNPDVLRVGIRNATGYQRAIPPIPRAFKNLLRELNGMRLFGGHLSINGVRRAIGGDPRVNRQPYGLADENIFRRPSRIGDDLLVIGGYFWDGSLLCVTDSTPNVVRLDRNGRLALNEWPNIETMLMAECSRLGQRFSETGELTNPNTPTTPEDHV